MAKRNHFGSYLKLKEELRIKEEHDKNPKVIAARLKARKLQLLQDERKRIEFRAKQEEIRRNALIFHNGKLMRVKDLED